MPETTRPIAEKTLHIPSDLQFLATVRVFLREVFAGLADDPVDRMELAANEVTVNIMKHAYRGLADGSIAIRAAVHPDRICVTFADRGVPFNPEAVPQPIFDGSQEGGFGLFIVSRVVDRFDYHAGGDENRTTLCIRLPCLRIPQKT